MYGASIIQKETVIVGGGFSGLGIAMALIEAGLDDLVILEKAAQLGGTWRENTYPGCACDVPSQFYSYSFEPKHDWSRVFAEQAEIQGYLLDVARRHGLERFVELATPVRAARWDEELRRWRVETDGAIYEARYLMGCQGPLHEPRLPDVPGLDRFAGTTFHSAAWDHDHDLAGRRVAVVGTGSSSIQLVPEIQPEVERLLVFQRTAPWVLPKPDHAIAPLEQAAFRYLPGFQKAYRNAIWGASELLQWSQRDPARMALLERLGNWHRERQVRDPELRERVRPGFALGCKRLLLSNRWYPAIQQPNVELVSAGVREIRPTGIVDAHGVERAVDTIIFATGFHVSDASLPKHIHGADGRTLDEHWGGSPEAYLGTTVRGFPNLFLLLGPNLGNGHGSAFVIIEAQARYIVSALRHARKQRVDRIEVRTGPQRIWNEQVQAALAPTVWNAGGCSSWYIDATGRNSAIYPWSTFDMRARMRRFDARAYDLSPARRSRRRRRPAPIELEGAVVAITGGARGIGLATARRFLEAGASVAIGDLDEAEASRAARELGGGARAFALDVSTRASFERFVADVERELGPLDVLVNNAGIMPSGDFLSEPDAVDAAVIAVNHRGPSLGMKIALPGMIARGRGHVVNVASLAGKLGVPYLASYVASKHATVGLSEAVRGEIAGTGVTISTVMPTAVRTRLAGGVSLRGLFAQEPDDVARAIVRSVSTRAPEITVPEGAWPIPPLNAVLPGRLRTMIPRLLRADRILRPEVRAARSTYEDQSVAQGRVPRSA